MQLSKVNEWAVLAATVGVALGILLLAYEISLNRKVVQAQIYQSRSAASQNFNVVVMESDKIAPLLAEFGATTYQIGSIDRTRTLSSEERVRLAALANALKHTTDNNVYQYENGFLDDRYYEEVVLPAIAQLAPFWEEFGLLTDVRREFLDAIHESGAQVSLER